jgi:UDP-N-acetylmuramoyl-L-alanyl-D-glutamate--2,6-diaminopimelate ligase
MNGQYPALSQLLEGLMPQHEVMPWDRSILDVSQDSRDLKPGSLFLARAGLHSHGLDFLEQIIGQGLAAIIAEPTAVWDEARIAKAALEVEVPILPLPGLGQHISQIAGAFFGHPSQSMRLVGITGTNGKTSCALGLAQAFEHLDQTLVIGTLGHGRPGQITPGSHTTPDAVSLQRMLAAYLGQGVWRAVMEVSSHALDQGRVAALRFATAVFTNLSRDHLDYHGDMQSYGLAKAELFEMPGLGAAVINADDALAETLVGRLAPGVRLALYGSGLPVQLAARAELRLELKRLEARVGGLQLLLEVNGEALELSSTWLGAFNASNLMAMLGVLLLEGIAPGEAARLLAQVSPPPGRMEAFGGGQGPLVVVDYAHTPDALEQALKALRPHCPGRLALVFGCGGDRDQGKRPLMGAIAERLADRVILTNDNPRSEPGQRIVEAILAGMQQPERAEVELDRAAAIRLGLTDMGQGDLLAVCGKGHESTQQIGAELRDFSDRLWVQRLLTGEAA